MGKSGGDTVTQERLIPPFLQPFLTRETAVRTRALERLQGQLAGAGAQHLVEPLTAEQRAALEQLTQRGGGAGGFIPTAEDVFLRTARGEIQAAPESMAALRGFAQLDPLQDPAIREATTAAVRSLLPQISSTFARSGRSGSGLERAAIGQATADALTGLLGQQRQQSLAAAQALGALESQGSAQRFAAAQLLPQIAAAGPGLLAGAGDVLQQQRQRELEAPITAQERLLAAASGTPAASLLGTAQSTSAGGGSPVAGALGGGLTGAQLGGILGKGLGEIGLGTIGSYLGPIGGIAGLVLGGLLSR